MSPLHKGSRLVGRAAWDVAKTCWVPSINFHRIAVCTLFLVRKPEPVQPPLATQPYIAEHVIRDLLFGLVLPWLLLWSKSCWLDCRGRAAALRVRAPSILLCWLGNGSNLRATCSFPVWYNIGHRCYSIYIHSLISTPSSPI